MTFRKSASRRTLPRPLRGETLETRRVMAAAVNLSPDGALTIEGDAENNRIWVATNRAGDRMRVVADGATSEFATADVSTISVFAGGGHDSVRISRSTELPTRIFGGEGNDRLNAGGGRTFIQGGEGRDRIRGGSANDVIFGGPGADRISGGRGDDILVGGSEGDIIRGGLGNDRIFGDAANGRPAVGEDSEAAVDEPGSENEAGLLQYLRENVNELEGNDIISGGRGNDMIHAGNGNDRVRGGSGDDFINGGDGRDSLNGERGDDELIGGLGRDFLRGGLGADVIRARDETVDLIHADADDELIVDPEDVIRLRRTAGSDVAEDDDAAGESLESTV